MKINTKNIALMVWLPIVLVLLWWFGSADSENLYFPPLSFIMWTFGQDWFGEGFAQNAWPSIVSFVLGFLGAAASGVVLGVLVGLSQRTSAALSPLIHFMRSVPPPALLPIALLLFGIGQGMSIAIIAFGAVWPTLLNTIDGIRALDSQVDDVMKSYQMGFWKSLTKVRLPAAGPQIFAGLRVSLQLSIILIVVSEMYGSAKGIGFYILNAQQLFTIPETWAGTILLGFLGFLATMIFTLIERIVLKWHKKFQLQTEAA